MPKWSEFARWIFYGLLSYVALGMSNKLEQIEANVQGHALFKERVEVESGNSKLILKDHEDRLRVLERSNKQQ